MLWVAVSLLLLQTVAGINPICHIFIEATEDKFVLLNLVGLAQYLPNSTEAELTGLVDEAKALGIRCCSAVPPIECVDDLSVALPRFVCTNESLTEKNCLKDCCEKAGDERIACFHNQKTEIARDHESNFPGEDCAAFKADGEAYFKSYIYSFAKTHPLVPPLAILDITKRYISLMTSCCDSNEVQTCFDTQKPVFDAHLKKQLTQLRVSCIILDKYGDGLLEDKKIVKYNEKFPEFTTADINPWAKKMVTTIAPCCQGNMVACMQKRKQLIDVLCNNENNILHSPNLEQCCKLDVISRAHCINNIERDDKPDDPEHKHYDLQDHIKDVCESFNASARDAVTNLLGELSHDHHEASEGLLFRYVIEAEKALTNCCASEDYAECVNSTMSGVDLEQSITDAIAKYNATRDQMAALGHFRFEESLFVKYTRSMPQATFDQLHHQSKEVADVYEECLKSDHNPLTCENELTNIVDEMCHDYDMGSINSQVDNCCKESYSSRLDCIMSMTPDTDFQSPDALNTTYFPMEPELCSRNDEELVVLHKMLRYNLLRRKLNITEDEYSRILTLFTITRTACCSKEDQKDCFTDAVPKWTGLVDTLFLNNDHH